MMANGEAGRPTKCTPETIDQVCSLVRAGNYAVVAAGYSGISEQTYYSWIERGRPSEKGEPGEEPYATFLESLTRAEQQAEATAVAHLKQGGQDHRVRAGNVEVREEQEDGTVKAYEETWVQGDWRATEAFLRRRFTKRWGDKQKHEHTGAESGPMQIAITPIERAEVAPELSAEMEPDADRDSGE